jgi:hypothetical protein
MRNSQRPCITRKGHQGLNPGGHNFVFLNVSINKKPIFFSEVVIYEKKIGLLLIEVFSKPFNPNNDGHLKQLWVAIFIYQGI